MAVLESDSVTGHRPRCSWENTQEPWTQQVLHLLLESRKYNSPGYHQNSLTEHLQYNGDGMIEEFVPSISEALKEDNGYVYFFCEPLEQEHWHYCQGQYD